MCAFRSEDIALVGFGRSCCPKRGFEKLIRRWFEIRINCRSYLVPDFTINFPQISKKEKFR
jgi:hypothetical protein